MPNPRKPLKQHKLDGTYRADRHGDRNPVEAVGVPERPAGMPPLAASWWDSTVPKLIDLGVVGLIDGPALEHAAWAYALMREAYQYCQIDPTDKNSRISFVDYQNTYRRVLAEFGLAGANSRDQISSYQGLDL